MVVYGGVSHTEYQLELPVYLSSCTTVFGGLEKMKNSTSCRLNVFGVIACISMFIMALVLIFKSHSLGEGVSIIKFVAFSVAISLLMLLVGFIAVYASLFVEAYLDSKSV
jgi:ABC-type transport system involved in cytochrome c biogenesis permease subunit